MNWKLVSIGFLGIVAGFATLWFFLKKDPVTQASYDSIHLGMTIEEVVGVFGAPGGDLDARTDDKRSVSREVLDMQFEGDWVARPGDNEPNRRFGWAGQDGIIVIRIDQDQRVTDRMFITLKPLSVFQRIRNLTQ
jgi:hypothetical protein